MTDPNWERWIGRATGIIALLSVATLLLTVVHDWGYFKVVGSHFQSLQTPTDYLANSLFWLPAYAAAYLLVLFVSFTITPLIFGAKGEDGGFVRRKSLRKFLPWRFFLVATPGLIFIAASLDSIAPLLLLIPVALTDISHGAYKNQTISAVGFGAAAATNLLLLCTGFFFIFAQLEADFDLRSYSPVYRIELKSGGLKHAVVLRNMERGILLHHPAEKRVEFVRWDDVRALASTPTQDTVAIRLLCRWLPLCNAPNP